MESTATRPEAPPLLLRYSPWQRLVAAVVGFGLAAGGFAFIHFPTESAYAVTGQKLRVLGWYCLAVGGGLGVVGLALALSGHRGVAVEINHSGILNRRGRWPLIAWGDIRCVTVRYLTLEIHPLEPAKLTRLPFDGLTIDISLTGLAPGEKVVAEYLQRHHAVQFQSA